MSCTRPPLGSGAISANGHGNVSVRVPGAEEMYYTSAPSLEGLRPEGTARNGHAGGAPRAVA